MAGGGGGGWGGGVEGGGLGSRLSSCKPTLVGKVSVYVWHCHCCHQIPDIWF